MDKDTTFAPNNEFYTTMFRSYDPRKARWMQRDPIHHPWESSYSAFGSNPVMYTDPLGADKLQGMSDKSSGTELDHGTTPEYTTPEVEVTAAKPAEGDVAGYHGSMEMNQPIYFHNGGKSQISLPQQDQLITNWISNYYNTNYNPKSDGFDTQGEFSKDFIRKFESKFAEIWGSGQITNDGMHKNPFFKGDGVTDNSQEIAAYIMIISGAARAGIGALLNNSLKYIEKDGFTYIVKEGYLVRPSKFEYFLGRVKAGPDHNIARSAQNIRDFTHMGVVNDEQLFQIMKNGLKGEEVGVLVNQYGTTISRKTVVNEKGAVVVKYLYRGVFNKNEIGGIVPEVTSMMPKTGVYKP